MAGQTSELDPDRLHMLFELAKVKISKGDKVGVLVSELGGLISFGPDIVEAYGMAGEYVKRILNGESPSTMACSRPSRFKVYVNRATAQQQLGITTIPTTLLGHPVQVI